MRKPEEALLELFQLDQDIKPILWVGAGLSTAAGFPTWGGLKDIIRKKLSDPSASCPVDAYLDQWGGGELDILMETHLGKPYPITPSHVAIARLVAADLLAAVFTTNYDHLIEDALTQHDPPVDFKTQVQQDGYQLRAMKKPTVLKVHGDKNKWSEIILSERDYDAFARTFPILKSQMDVDLRSHRILFVGCSMTDPRILDWLRSLSNTERRNLLAARVLITESDWSTIPQADRDLFKACRIHPITVTDYDQIPVVLTKLADLLVPKPPPQDWIFRITPGETTWRIERVGEEGSERVVDNPVTSTLIKDLKSLREQAAKSFLMEAAEATAQWELPKTFGDLVTTTLLSNPRQQALQRRMNQTDRARPHVHIQVPQGTYAQHVLCLPWELLMPHPEGFPVALGRLSVSRELMVDGAPGLTPPNGPLRVAVSIAAPEGASALRYEDESARITQTLAAYGLGAAFAELGTVEDLVEMCAHQKPTVIHFSGHGHPGALLFEDDYGMGKAVPVKDLVAPLNAALRKSGGALFPKLFFLGCGHGASRLLSDVSVVDDPKDSPKLDRLDEHVSTAAALQEQGFTQIVGYFGPVSDALCTRSELAFYEALATGETTLDAVNAMRFSMSKPFEVDREQRVFPLAWMQVALYHRGQNLALALAKQQNTMTALKPRQINEVGGLPVLEHGFIGRRAQLHEIRRSFRKGQRIFLLQGLGGLGKTAMASYMLTRIFAKEQADRLVLTFKGLTPSPKALSELMDQVIIHGNSNDLHAWDAAIKEATKASTDPLLQLEALLSALRGLRPKLVIYCDNMETLQVPPDQDAEHEEMGAWMPFAKPLWTVLEQQAEKGMLLGSTRYRWPEADANHFIGLTPLSEAASLRLLESFDEFKNLPQDEQIKLAKRADGHPRTLEFLDILVRDQRKKQGLRNEDMATQWQQVLDQVLAKQQKQIDGDLLLEDLWNGLNQAAKDHAQKLLLLREPAPAEVIESVGACMLRLKDMGLLTRHRTHLDTNGHQSWQDRWQMHPLVEEKVRERSGSLEDAAQKNIYASFGKAYNKLYEDKGLNTPDQLEAIHHLHQAGLGVEAYPLVKSRAIFLRTYARYREARALLQESQKSGNRGDTLADCLVMQAQMEGLLGESYDEANRLLTEALNHVEQRKTKGFILHELGSLAQKQGKYSEAEGHLRQSLEINEEVLGKRHPDYATSLHTLASVLVSQGKYSEAEGHLRQSLEIYEEVLGKRHPSYATNLHELARVLSSQGKYSEAEGHLRQSLEIKEELLGKRHPDYAASLHALASVLSSQGKYSEAEGHFHQSLEIKEEVLGKPHPSYAASLHALAGVLSSQGKNSEAEGHFRQSLEIYEEVLGKRHPSYAFSLVNLGSILRKQGRAKEGLTHAREAVEIFTDTFGLRHPQTAQANTTLAYIAYDAGEPNAPEIAKQAIELLHQTLGPQHPWVLNDEPGLRRIAGLEPSAGGESQQGMDLGSMLVQLSQAPAEMRDAFLKQVVQQVSSAGALEPFAQAVQQLRSAVPEGEPVLEVIDALLALIEGS